MTLLASNIRFLRNRLKLSQTAFAEKVGMNRGNIASYEKGLAEPSYEKLLRLAGYFNINLHDLLEKDLASLWEHSPSQKLELTRVPTSREMEEARKELARLQKIFDGLKNLHHYERKEREMPEETRQLVADYERLLGLTEQLFTLNNGLFGNTYS